MGEFSSPAASSTSIIRQATVTLTDAQIKAWPSAAVEIVVAPGADKRIVPIYGIALFNSLAGAYTNVTASGSWYFTMAGACVSSYIPTSGFIDQAAKWDFPLSGFEPVEYAPLSAIIANPQDASANTNVALQFFADNSAGNYTGGNAANTLKVSVTYMVLNTTTGLFEAA